MEQWFVVEYSPTGAEVQTVGPLLEVTAHEVADVIGNLTEGTVEVNLRPAQQSGPVGDAMDSEYWRGHQDGYQDGFSIGHQAGWYQAGQGSNL